jgi:hypothetical protein
VNTSIKSWNFLSASVTLKSFKGRHSTHEDIELLNALKSGSFVWGLPGFIELSGFGGL